MIQGTLKKVNGKQIIVYDINGMELYTETDNLVHPQFVQALNDDLNLAMKVFWSSDEENWQGVMNSRDVEEVLHKMMILSRCPTEACETPRSTSGPMRAKPGKNGIEPVVGMGASIGYGSDSDPYTVIAIKTPSHIIVQADEWSIISGSEGDGSARYEYAPDPHGSIHDVTLRRDGYWKVTGTSTIVGMGGRRRYRDPSF